MDLIGKPIRDSKDKDPARAFRELLDRMTTLNAQFSEEEVAEDVAAEIRRVRAEKGP